jgi:CBS domain containing-hemolysin-like protein
VSRLRELFADQLEAGQRVMEDGEDSDDEDLSEIDGRSGAGSLQRTLYLPQHYEATTLGGLVSEIAGRIPLPGEVIEGKLLRLEVVASTDRKVERVRVGLMETAT